MLSQRSIARLQIEGRTAPLPTGPCHAILPRRPSPTGKSSMRSALPRTLAAVLMLAPTTAFAHTGAGYAHGFSGGFAHPLRGLDPVLAMITVRIFARQLGRPAIFLV